MSLVFGLTGNIASGKSTVLDILLKLGASTINADLIGHDILDRPEVIQTLSSQQWFNVSILDKENHIDRAALGSIVWSDPAKLKRLNGFMWPLIREEIAQRVEAYRNTFEVPLIVEGAVIYEAGFEDLFDFMIVVAAPQWMQMRRLVARNPELTTLKCISILESQMPVEEKIRRADVLIFNDCSKEELAERVSIMWSVLYASYISGNLRPRNVGPSGHNSQGLEEVRECDCGCSDEPGEETPV